MFERFTAGARNVVTGAQTVARDLGHPYIGTEHVLIALLGQDGGRIAPLLADAGVDADFVRQDVRRRVDVAVQPDLSFTEADAEDAAALKAIGIDLAAVRAAIEANFGTGALHLPPAAKRKRGLFGRRAGTAPDGTVKGHIPFTARNKKVLELSLREALRLRHNFIAPEHIMLGVLREGEGLAMLIMADKGVDFDRLRDDLARSLESKAA
jgi:ATP-dependent Clp protease ATP-binding subunit ClpA